MKIIKFILNLFSMTSSCKKFYQELIPFLIVFLFNAIIMLTVLPTIEIRVFGFFIILIQTICFFGRLSAVSTNKIKILALSGKYKFKCKPLKISYTRIKKMIRENDSSFRLYCESHDHKIHIIEMTVSKFRRRKRYFFDTIECEYEVVMRNINEKLLVNNSYIVVVQDDTINC